MESCNLPPRQYSILQKAKAFVRGLPGSPLLEVAREGIRGKRSLSPLSEFRYAARLAEHGTSRFLCEALEQGCSRNVQDIFATALKNRFDAKLRFISAISYALWEGGHGPAAFAEACRPDALGLSELRKSISKALASGRVSSSPAQKELVPILRHYNILDRYFGVCVPELAGHEIAILVSPDCSDDLKKLVIREMADSRSIPSKGMLGLPLTPYDFEPQI